MTELPPMAPDFRWTARRKAAVVEAIAGGEIERGAAMARYGLSVEELGAWERRYAADGLQALKATRVQDDRPGVRRVKRL